MKTIRIFIVHPHIHDLERMLSYLKIQYLKDKFHFVWASDSPDYLVASEHIYVNRKCNELFKKLSRKNPITIFHGGEAETPDFNIFDYAVSFDSDLMNGDRYAQLPPPFIFFRGFFYTTVNPIDSIAKAERELHAKKGFCNFLYSNWNAHPNRDKLFYLLSSYKHVDSLGKHLNNVGNKPTGFGGHVRECIPLKKPYKFSIASENAVFNGYTSEKILTSLGANTVPVYWGNPKIILDVNPQAFINCFDYDSFDDVLEKVKEIDNNDKLWCEMISQPWQTKEQINNAHERMNKYISLFENIFSQDFKKAHRVPQGTHPQYYKKYFLKADAHEVTRCVIIKNKLEKLIKNKLHINDD